MKQNGKEVLKEAATYSFPWRQGIFVGRGKAFQEEGTPRTKQWHNERRGLTPVLVWGKTVTRAGGLAHRRPL